MEISYCFAVLIGGANKFNTPILPKYQVVTNIIWPVRKAKSRQSPSVPLPEDHKSRRHSS